MRDRSPRIVQSALPLVLLAMLSSIPSVGQHQTSGGNAAPETLEYGNLFAKIDSLLDSAAIPGAAVALVSSDSPTIAHYYGFSDLEAPKAVSPNTQFCVGSCTKSFLGVTFLALCQEGKVDINAPIVSFAGNLPIENRWSKKHPIRLIHLLEHSAGFDDIRPSSLYNPKIETPLIEALRRNPSLLKARWPPGTCYSYSSPGFTLAGHILENVTGEQFEDYISDTLLRPLGMTEASLRIRGHSSSLLARGYDEKNRPLPYIQGFDRPASSLNASALDMARFIEFLLNHGRVGGKQLIAESLMERIGRPTSTLAAKSGLVSGYSFGVNAFQHNGWEWKGHVGGGPGTLVRYAYCDDLGVGYVVMANRLAPNTLRSIAVEIREVLSAGRSGLAPSPTHVPAEFLDRLSGYYELKNPRQHLLRAFDILFHGVTISVDRDTLRQKGFLGSSIPLLPVTDLTYRALDESLPSRAFMSDPNGKTVFCTPHMYYVRASAIRAYAFRWAFLVCLALIGTVPLYALFWITATAWKLVRRRSVSGRLLSIRFLPFAALAAFVLGAALLASYPTYLIGTRTHGTVGFCVGSWLFLCLSALGVFASLVWRRYAQSGFERVLIILQSGSCLGVAVLLWSYGIVGLQTWSY